MSSDKGRLLIARKTGQGFYVGDDIHVAINHLYPKRFEFVVRQGKDNPETKTYEVGSLQPLKITPEVTVEASIRRNRGQMQVFIEAPKSIRVLREELLDGKKGPVQRH